MAKVVRRAVISLSHATFSPVTYFLSLTIPELEEWCRDVAEIQKKGGE